MLIDILQLTEQLHVENNPRYSSSAVLSDKTDFTLHGQYKTSPSEPRWVMSSYELHSQLKESLLGLVLVKSWLCLSAGASTFSYSVLFMIPV